jgi:phosphatidylinositol 3,5-bisphosphate 5-phosphatase
VQKQVVKKAYGLMGFIKFLKGYYIVLITERKKIAKIGRHSIYQVEDIIIKPLFTQGSGSSQSKEEEAKYVQAFKDIGIANGFYFSYTYDITHSLQYNVLRQIKK